VLNTWPNTRNNGVSHFSLLALMALLKKSEDLSALDKKSADLNALEKKSPDLSDLISKSAMQSEALFPPPLLSLPALVTLSMEG